MCKCRIGTGKTRFAIFGWKLLRIRPEDQSTGSIVLLSD